MNIIKIDNSKKNSITSTLQCIISANDICSVYVCNKCKKKCPICFNIPHICGISIGIIINGKLMSISYGKYMKSSQ
jgi:hypothetical protein